MPSLDLKIPEERIAVLIGKKGETKRLIQREAKIFLTIDSETGTITISADDGFDLYLGEKIIKAIGRGFNPRIALTLLRENNSFELIDMSEFTKTKTRLKILKGRVIGTDGKFRKTLEGLLNVDLEVYGKTIGIIGETEKVLIARQAIINLLSGSRHANVYSWLERQKKNVY